jgi:hypothetical protein
MGEMRNAHILVGKPEGKKRLGKPQRSYVDNIRMHLRETEKVWTGFVWLRRGTSGRLL